MAVFKSITTTKPGTCKRCKQEVSVGTKVRWSYGQGIWHLKAECPASQEQEPMHGAA